MTTLKMSSKEEDKGKEYSGPISKAPTTLSRQKKQCSMGNHFKYFFENYYMKDNKEIKHAKTFPTLKEEDVTIHMVDSFAGYLANNARDRMRPDGPKLSYGTVDGYFSIFKTTLGDKYMDDPKAVPVVRNEALMTRMRKRMLDVKLQESRLGGKPLVVPMEAATEQDMDAFFLLCFYKGSAESAEFLHLLMSCITNCGRGSEVCN